MKKTLILLIIYTSAIQAIAQSVTISPTSTSALVDIKSTTNGFAPPRMSKSERDAIINPISGLIIFQTTTNVDNPRGYYYYNGSSWTRFAISSELPDASWITSGVNQYSAVSGNVGIGVTTPDDKLHIRSSSSSVGITLDATNPIIQFRQSGNSTAGYTDKGFLQLAGDNFRVGLNSSNINGKFVIRTHGHDQVEVYENNGGAQVYFNYNGSNVGAIKTTSSGNMYMTTDADNSIVGLNNELYINNTLNRVGIGTASPEEKLEVRGNVKIYGDIIMTGNISRTSAPDAGFIPVCYGRVSPSGDVVSGSGNFTSTRVSEGMFEISNPGILSGSTLLVTVNSSNAQIIAHGGCSSGSCRVYMKDAFGGFAAIDFYFSFVVYK